MLIKKYQPTLLWNANNGSHGSCLPSQNRPSGWTLISESTEVIPAMGTTGYSPSARQSLLCAEDKITQWAPVFGVGCQSNSSLEQAPHLPTAWEGSNGNKSPAGTLGIFSSIICVDKSNLDSSGSQIQGSDGISQGKFPIPGAKGNHTKAHSWPVTSPPTPCILEETNKPLNIKQTLIKYLIVTLTLPTSQQYLSPPPTCGNFTVFILAELKSRSSLSVSPELVPLPPLFPTAQQISTHSSYEH